MSGTQGHPASGCCPAPPEIALPPSGLRSDSHRSGGLGPVAQPGKAPQVASGARSNFPGPGAVRALLPDWLRRCLAPANRNGHRDADAKAAPPLRDWSPRGASRLS